MSEEQTHLIYGKAGKTILLSSLAELGWNKENYIFKGWGKTRDAKIIETRDGGTVIFENDTNLYAIWAPTDYLYFKALEPNARIKMTATYSSRFENIHLEYSLDNKVSWYQWSDPSTGSIFLNNVGDTVYIRARDKNVRFAQAQNDYVKFVIDGSKVSSGGNIMSLLDKDMFLTEVTEYCFCRLFENCTALVSAPELPATKLAAYCYNSMFSGCTNLISSSLELPAVEAYKLCYAYMFANCEKLESTPIIRLLNDLSNCAMNMFDGCKNLKNTYVTLNFNSGLKCNQSCSYMFRNHGPGLSVEVDFKEWTDTGCTGSWLESNLTYNAGTFICPSELKLKFDDNIISRSSSTVPSNWEIISK